MSPIRVRVGANRWFSDCGSLRSTRLAASRVPFDQCIVCAQQLGVLYHVLDGVLLYGSEATGWSG